MVLKRNIVRGQKRRIETRRIVLTGLIGIDDADEVVVARVTLLHEEPVVREERRVYGLQKCLVGTPAVHLPRGVCDHRRLGERARSLHTPAEEGEDARRPINDMRDHAVFELFGEERAQFGTRRCGIVLRENDRMETRIPEPLVRIVFLRGDGVLVPVGYPSVPFQEILHFYCDVDHGAIIPFWSVPDVALNPDTYGTRRACGLRKSAFPSSTAITPSKPMSTTPSNHTDGNATVPSISWSGGKEIARSMRTMPIEKPPIR